MNALLRNHVDSSDNKHELLDFIKDWQAQYEIVVKSIPIFDSSLTASWNKEKKSHFAKTFYHLRGNFHQFLWYMGNHTPNSKAKKIVIENIAEEFSPNGRSHELLYYDFANDLGVDLEKEIQTKANYLPFAVKFNQQHLEWLREHDWQSGFAAFSAYEKLDNVDYAYLYQLAESFNISKRALTFFSVHRHVDHFDNTMEILSEIWCDNPKQVKLAFDFIGDHQINMWRNLSEEMTKK